MGAMAGARLPEKDRDPSWIYQPLGFVLSGLGC